MRPVVSLVDVADAILDGTPVDWGSLDSAGGATDQELIAQLKTLAAVKFISRAAGSEHREAPTSWGHLKVLEPIGRGAFGEVFRAWDSRLDREVALKLLPPDSAIIGSPSSSVIEEGRLLARVRHPNVVTIHGAERLSGRIGLWMEFVKGRTLEQVLREGKRFSAREVTRIGLELCRAVSAVHAAGLLHRDIKAQNVMVADDGRLVLMDFGTGREVGGTSESNVAGTPLYLAPEVLSGGAATERSDVYSIGVLMHHLLTGSYPVQAHDLSELRRHHATRTRSDLRTSRPDVPQRLARIVERACDSEPDRRYGRADSLGEALGALEGLPVSVRRAYALAAAVALAAAGVAAWQVADRDPGASSSMVLAGAAAQAESGKLMLAVLPFENLTGNAGEDYFSDGLTEEMIAQLGRVDPQRLGVIARTSVMHFKTNRQWSRIGRELGVQYVLEGSVRRDTEKARVSVQLIQISDQTQKWSQQYDGELGSLLTFQGAIAREIAKEILLTLGRASEAPLAAQYGPPPTRVYRAYDLYLKGRYFWNKRTRAGFEQAIDYFHQALALDAGYARAHAGVADSYALMASYSLNPEFVPQARSAALRALELDEQLAEAHTSLALIAQNHDWDWQTAENEYRRAIELNPNYVTAHHWYAEFLAFQGRFEEAFESSERARRLDPLSLIIAADYGAILHFARQYDRAIEQFRAVRAVEPDFPRAHMIVGSYAESEMFPEALAEIDAWRRREDTPWTWAAEVYVYRRWGRQLEARRALANLEDACRRLQVDPSPLMGGAYVGIDNSKALAHLERAYLNRSNVLVSLKVDPGYDPVRTDPRFQDLLRRVGLGQ
jgi:TolB-like protein